MLEYISDMWALAIDGQKRGVVFFIALYAMLVVGWSFVYQCRIRRWPATAGSLAAAGIEKFGHANRLTDQDYRVSALYSYRVNGSRYQGKRVSSWVVVASHNAKAVLNRQLAGIQHLPDNGVMVFYNPRRPDKSFLIQPGMVSLIFTLTVAVGPLMLYWVNYHG